MRPLTLALVAATLLIAPPLTLAGAEVGTPDAPQPLPAQAAGVLPTAPAFIVAGPNAQAVNYATPVALAQPGAALTFANADLVQHNVISDGYGPDTKPWCTTYPAGKCPLFLSGTAYAGGRVVVRGTESLVSGKSYGFHCSYHGNMDGTLIALPPSP